MSSSNQKFTGQMDYSMGQWAAEHCFFQVLTRCHSALLYIRTINHVHVVDRNSLKLFLNSVTTKHTATSQHSGQVVMAFPIGKEDLPTVLDYLKLHLPDSVVVCNVVKRILEGQDPGLQVWSSSEKGSEYNVIVVTTDPERCQSPYYRRFVHLFCTDPSAIMRTLSSPGVLHLNDKLHFFAVSERDMSYIESMDIWKNYKITANIPVYQYSCSDLLRVPRHSLPEGFRESEITSDILETVLKVYWARQVMGAKDALQDLINWNFQSVCVYNEDGVLVAWARESFWSEQGSLYVSESCRGKGIGTFIASRLARKIIEKEGSVYAYIDIDNAISAKLHQSAGFTKISEEKMVFRVYTENS